MTDTVTDATVTATEEAKLTGPVVLKVETDKKLATVQAANGRIIGVKPIEAVSFYKLTKALGPSANNSATMDLAMLAASVVKINRVDANAGEGGDLVLPFPRSDGEIEDTIKMLGFDGLAAVGAGLKALNENTYDGIQAAKN